MTAREVSEGAWRQNFGEESTDSTYVLVNSALSMQGDGDDIIVTVLKADGTEASFVVPDAATLDSGSYTNETETEFVSVFLGNNLTFQDLMDDSMGSGYAFRVGAYYDDFSEEFATEVRSVLGTETMASALDDLAAGETVIAYNGIGGLSLRADGFGFNDLNASIFGDLAMTADFGAGTIGGEWSNLFLEVRAGQVVNEEESGELLGAVVFEETNIQAGGFAGSLSADEILSGSDAEVSALVNTFDYSGTFYGNNAEEIGGTFSGTGTIDGNTYTGVGSFTANNY